MDNVYTKNQNGLKERNTTQGNNQIQQIIFEIFFVTNVWEYRLNKKIEKRLLKVHIDAMEHQWQAEVVLVSSLPFVPVFVAIKNPLFAF